jgi:GNAT superfamily N-acetyltransferase
MVKEPSKFTKLIMKARRWPLTRQIKTQEQAQMVHEETLKELQRRKEFFQDHNNNFKTTMDENSIYIQVIGENQDVIGAINAKKIDADTWQTEFLHVGEYSSERNKYRDLGFGKKLLEKLIKELKQKGCKKLFFRAKYKMVEPYEKWGARKEKTINVPGFGILMSFDLTKYESK